MTKLFTFLSCILFISLASKAQNELYNDGSLIYIDGQSGATKAFSPSDMPSIFVGGEIVNASGQLENVAGEIQLTGNFTNTDTYRSTGDEIFINSTSDQTVSGVWNGTGSDNNFNNLFVEKASNYLNLVNDVNVRNYFELLHGMVRTDAVSHTGDGSAYPNELYIMNVVPGEFITATSGNTRYVEGRLRRATSSGNSYFFPIGAANGDFDGMEPATISINSGSNSIIGYLRPATFNYTDVIFQDIGTDPAPGYSALSSCVAGAGGDGILDAFQLSNDFPQEWVFTSSGLNYDITLQPGPALDGTVDYTSVCGGTWTYLLKNGIPGGDGHTIGAGPNIPTGYGTSLSSFNGVNLAPTGKTLTAQTSFSAFRLHGPSMIGGALPVTYLSIEAKAINNQFIQVSWSTATELNNKGFAVQRSTDGANYNQIGWIAANGDGNATSTSSYTFKDEAVVANQAYYYRLQQTDKDAKTNLSKVVTASLQGTTTASISVGEFYPNPSTDLTTIDIQSQVAKDLQVVFYNNLNQLVSVQDFHLNKGENSLKIAVANLAAGIYHGVFTSQDAIFSKKIIITKP